MRRVIASDAPIPIATPIPAAAYTTVSKVACSENRNCSSSGRNLVVQRNHHHDETLSAAASLQLLA
jgi:hypothetical protein